jgi:hypothetical protein
MVLPKRLMRGIQVVIMMDIGNYMFQVCFCRRMMRTHIFKTLSHNNGVFCLIFLTCASSFYHYLLLLLFKDFNK